MPRTNLALILAAPRRERRLELMLHTILRPRSELCSSTTGGAWQPLKVVARSPVLLLPMIAWWCVWLCYYHPLDVAKSEGVLTGEAVRHIALSKAREMLETDARFASTPLGIAAVHEAELARIRARSNIATSNLAEMKETLEIIDAFDKLRAVPKTEPKFLGFVDSKVHYMYFCVMFFLACHVLLASSEPQTFKHLETPRNPLNKACCNWRADWWLASLLGALIFCALYYGWHYLSEVRATVLEDYGRTVFSFVHHDIGPESYRWQACRSQIVCAFVAASIVLSWRKDTIFADSVRQWHIDTGEMFSGAGTLQLPPALSTRRLIAKNAFRNWQVHSACLAAAFVPWAYYYWSLDDTRYYMSNLVFQVIWGITWWQATASAIRITGAFESYRSEVLLFLVNKEASSSLLATVRDEIPVSFTSIVSSGVAAVATYFAPILHKILS